MDVRMPGMDGLRTAEVISQRESAARVPIIFLTAVPIGNADVVSGYARGAVDFLLKPFDPEILRSKVSVFVDLYQKEQMIKRQAGLLRQRDREAFERRSELRFRSLMDALPQCVWVARADLTFYYWNKRAVDYIGVPASVAVSADRLFEFVHPDDLDTIRSEWELCTSLQRAAEVQVRLQAACRRRVPMVPDARSSAARRIRKSNRMDRRRNRHRYGASGVGRSRRRQPHEGGISRDGVARAAQSAQRDRGLGSSAALRKSRHRQSRRRRWRLSNATCICRRRLSTTSSTSRESYAAKST